MKKQILESLRTKFEGVSDAILSRVAEKLSKTTTSESDIESAVEGVTFQSLLESYGDSRATEAQQSAVKNYETKYGLKNGEKVQTEPKDEPKDEPDVPEWAKKLIEDNKAMKAQLDSNAAEKLTAARRAQLDAVVSKLPEKLRAPYARINVTNLSDEDFQSQLGSITTEVESIASEMKQSGAVFGRPRSAASGKTVNEEEEVNPEVLKYLDAQTKSKEEDGQNF